MATATSESRRKRNTNVLERKLQKVLGLRTLGLSPNRIPEHEAILQAFKKGTVDEAAACVRVHRLGAAERLAQVFIETEADAPQDNALAA